MTEDEMVGWHQPLNGHEFEQALGDGEGQGGLVCCSPWGRKELDTTERLNRPELSLVPKSMLNNHPPQHIYKDSLGIQTGAAS